MHKSLRATCALGLLAALLAGASEANAAPSLTGQLNEALGNKNVSSLQSLLAQNPSGVDEIIKGILRTTQSSITKDPDFSTKMMSLAGEYAPKITPPSVPAVCADLRRIVEMIPETQKGMPLHTAVVNTAQNFASSPVVVAAGRPNLCEEAWLKAANLPGEALLAQQPGMRSPGLPPVTINPGIPTSAD